MCRDGVNASTLSAPGCQIRGQEASGAEALSRGSVTTSYHETGDGQRTAIAKDVRRDATEPVRPQRPASADGQLARVAALLRERRTRGLSSREAVDLGILRLPNRICELRARGWIISSKREAVTDCLRYFLVSEPIPPVSNYAERTHKIEREAAPLFAGEVTSR